MPKGWLMETYRVMQKGEQFVVQHLVKFLWFKLWLDESVAFIWYLGIYYRIPCFISAKDAILFIDILNKWPTSFKYRGFTLRRCWSETDWVLKEPSYYNSLHSSPSPGGRFTSYYTKSMDGYKKFIDEHIERKQRESKRIVIYP